MSFDIGKYKRVESFLLDFEKVKNTIFKKKKEYEKPPANLHLLKKHSSIEKTRPKQAVVKLLSNLNPQGIKNALRYTITNSLENFAINQYGEKQSMQEIFKEWEMDFTGKKNAKEAWHLCFSINESLNNKNLYALEQSVKTTLEKNFYNHKYCYVIHTHQNKPHIHVLVNKNDMFSHKKLHFNDKNEIKSFFNTLRNDFCDGLNYYGLNYYNAYKSEKTNFLEQNLNSFLYKDSNQLNIVTHLEKTADRIYKKIDNFNNKIPKVDRDLKKLYERKNELITKINFYKANCDNNLEKTLFDTKRKFKQNYKKYDSNKAKFFQTAKKIKELNKEINKHKKQNYFYKKEINKLHNIAKDIESKMQNVRDKFVKNQQEFFADLREKDSYINYLQTYKKYASTENIIALKNIQKEMRLNSQNIFENIKNFINLDKKILDSIIANKDSNTQNLNTNYALRKLLGTKLSSKALIDSKKNIDKFFHILKSMDRYVMIKRNEMSEDSFQHYYKLLKENSHTISLILNEKLQNLESLFKNQAEIKQYDNKSLRYLQKELNALKKYIESADNTKHDMKYLNDFENKTKLQNLNTILQVVRQNILEQNAKLTAKAKILNAESKQKDSKLSQNQTQIQRQNQNKNTQTLHKNIESNSQNNKKDSKKSQQNQGFSR
ncbi:hypothetical protein DCO58_11910 [Helicobacter saguini]|uniref:MobA/VirD2-like nuclease domain-containing protein n=1 Tax=Helicobacter saguini TaxID=1548018 RepID=A0A347W6I1_9HELI|nr:hypothetical protein [Helicobacter saguini]MWV61006.1 hypothetical protein [Helicobacter saguini]MWV68325.1 hypothetical protein [Helicobacter saguini]MWV70210.1 hypothetical protein [Helicobacter saguini]MWV72113.1 hypothetical protein [Helicobacter saguini]TLD91472.1 hypothetical protein LS64_011975 [Helicobacter saguini]